MYVGIRQDKGSDVIDASLTLAAIATVNEFGSSDGHVPERSFLRSTVDKHEVKYFKRVRDIVGEAPIKRLSGNPGSIRGWLKREFGRLGLEAVKDVRETITQMDSPPNAPSTIRAKKGADNPLIDTGRLRQSIDHELRWGFDGDSR